MDFLTDWLTDWLKELLIGGIMGNLEGLFDYVNTQVGEIAVQVGTTPAAWNAGVFSLIRQLSETVILPIAGLVLTFVATYELIQMLLEKNNMHEFDVANIYKWMFKTACAIFILSNTFDIVMAVFDVSQTVIAQAGGLIQGSTDITPDMITELETTLEGMDLGPLLGLWLQSSIIGVTMWALGIVIFVLVYGRMLEIYLLTSLAPIPMATISHREVGQIGQGKLIGFASVNIGGIVIDDFKVVNGKNGIFLGEPSKPDPTTRTGYRSTARVTNRALQERLSAAAADGYNMAVEKLIARAEALRPKPIREQMANAAKEAAKENATRPAQAKGKEARDDR